jgi:hypothetical protein
VSKWYNINIRRRNGNMVNKELRFFITTKEGKYFEPNWIMEGYQEGEKLLLSKILIICTVYK